MAFVRNTVVRGLELAKANTTSKSSGRGTKSGGSGAKKSAKKTTKSGSGSGGSGGAGGGSSKKTAKKPAAKKTTKKAAASGAAKKSTSKAGSKKASAKKTAGKAPVSKKPAAKKAPAAGSKKAASKASEKKATTKKSGGAADTKGPAEKASAEKAGAKSGGGSKKSKAAEPKAEAGKAGESGGDAGGDDKKPNRKGITIVSKKPARKKNASKPTPKFPPTSGMLLGPNSPVRRPLIPSGPSAAPPEDDSLDANATGKKKSPFNKRELDKFRRILLVKRAELIGDVSAIEAEALLGSAGDLSSLPQHLAEQGSDSYERSLSLDLAAADRRLIKEIDEALQRIDEGVYGLCEQTGKAIRKARLEELPWARYSIEAARAMERSGHPG